MKNDPFYIREIRLYVRGKIGKRRQSSIPSFSWISSFLDLASLVIMHCEMLRMRVFLLPPLSSVFPFRLSQLSRRGFFFVSLTS